MAPPRLQPRLGIPASWPASRESCSLCLCSLCLCLCSLCLCLCFPLKLSSFSTAPLCRLDPWLFPITRSILTGEGPFNRDTAGTPSKLKSHLPGKPLLTLFGEEFTTWKHTVAGTRALVHHNKLTVLEAMHTELPKVTGVTPENGSTAPAEDVTVHPSSASFALKGAQHQNFCDFALFGKVTGRRSMLSCTFEFALSCLVPPTDPHEGDEGDWAHQSSRRPPCVQHVRPFAASGHTQLLLKLPGFFLLDGSTPTALLQACSTRRSQLLATRPPRSATSCRRMTASASPAPLPAAWRGTAACGLCGTCRKSCSLCRRSNNWCHAVAMYTPRLLCLLCARVSLHKSVLLCNLK